MSGRRSRSFVCARLLLCSSRRLQSFWSGLRLCYGSPHLGATARRVSRRSRATTAADGDLPSRLGPPLGGAETTGAGFGPTPPARRASRGVIPLSAGPRRPFGQAMSSGITKCAPTSLRADTGVVRGRPTRVRQFVFRARAASKSARFAGWRERVLVNLSRFATKSSFSSSNKSIASSLFNFRPHIWDIILK